jgi:hypothetical protein
VIKFLDRRMVRTRLKPTPREMIICGIALFFIWPFWAWERYREAAQ